MRNIFTLTALLLVASPVISYFPQSTDINGIATAMKWATASFPIVWQMNPTAGSNLSGTREQAEVYRSSFQQWEAITTASISFTEGSATNPSVKPAFDKINLITTNITPGDFNSTAVSLTATFSFTSTGIDQFGRIVEFPGQIIEADIMFNPESNFTTDILPKPSLIDLESTMTHEVGHMLGLDHSNILSSTMFPSYSAGVISQRDLQSDDRIGISTIYPSISFQSLGSISGKVRTTGNVGVFGAMVVALDVNGRPTASAITKPNGNFLIKGLPEGVYTVYAEPMNKPILPNDMGTLDDAWPKESPNTNFTVRFR